MSSSSLSFLCNICGDDIDDISKQITLQCNPNHTFCYDCIYDWYFHNKNNEDQYGDSNVSEPASCPICRKKGGYLPLPEGVKPIYNVHIPEIVSKISSYLINSKCECMTSSILQSHECKSYAHYDIQLPSSIKTECVGSGKSVLKVCYHHYKFFKDGGDLLFQIENQDKKGKKTILFPSFYKKEPCTVITGSGNQCIGNANPNKDGNILKIQDKFCVCKKHLESFEKGSKIEIKNIGMISKSTLSQVQSQESQSQITKEAKKKPKVVKKAVKKEEKKEELKLEESIIDPNEIFGPIYDPIEFDMLYEDLCENLALLKSIIEEKKFEKQVEELESSLLKIGAHIQKIKDGNIKSFDEVRKASDHFYELLEDFTKKESIEKKEKEKENNFFDLLKNQMKSMGNQEKNTEKETKKETEKETKEITFDLYNYQMSPYCNVRLKNGKLCKNTASVHFNLKCGNHSHKSFIKEIFFAPTIKENNK